jgi:GH15 family glucan-1,4-alpha-glucosidase
MTVESSSASARLALRQGDRVGFALHHHKRADAGTARVWTQDENASRLADAVATWESWSQLHQAYMGPWHDLVHHSGRVLQALSFQPTGAICAGLLPADDPRVLATIDATERPDRRTWTRVPLPGARRSRGR